MADENRTTRVLVIDDDPREAQAVIECLVQSSDAPFRAVQARLLEHGLGILRSEPFDVALVSFDAEADTAPSALQSVVSASPDCAIVALLRSGDARDELTALEHGAAECVHRGVGVEQFVAGVRRALARSRAPRPASDLMAAIVRASADTIISLDREGMITSFNAGAERMFGYSAAEAIGHPFTMLGTPAQQVEQERWLRDLLSGADVFEQWTTRTRADGTQVHVSATSTPIYRRDGQIDGICCVMRDVGGLIGAGSHRERQEELLIATQSAAKIGSWEYEIESGRLLWSDEMYRLVGLEPSVGQVSPAEALSRIHPDDRQPMSEAARRWLTMPGAAMHQEFRVITSKGLTRTLMARGLHVQSADGRTGRLLGTAHDVSEEREQQAAELQAQQQFKRSFEGAAAPMWIAGTDGALREVNDALGEMLGRPLGTLVGAPFDSFLHPDEREGNTHTMEMLRSGQRPSVTREMRFLHADGHVVWAIAGITLIRHADGSPSHVIGQAQDITSRRRYEDRLRHMADHDPLTGLLNRRGFDRELRRHVSHISRYGATGALLIIDLDNFKQYNDTYGHTAGDNLIAAVSRGLHGRLRANDVISRIGGDEFAVLLPEADREQAEIVARALVAYVRDSPIASDLTGTVRLTTSLGIFTFEGEGPFSKDRAMIAADLAMYDSKAAGRNRWSHYQHREDETTMLAQERDRRRRVERGEAVETTPTDPE